MARVEESDSAHQADRSVPAVWSALGVRSDEIRAVNGLFRVSFLLGLALVTFYGASNALFLTTYDIDVLPWTYIVNAFVVVAVGLIYAAASRRFNVQQLLIGSAVALAATVVALWLWATLSDADAVAFMIGTWFRLLFIFGFLGLWEIASTIFDVRQAKRLFPAVALGAMLAFIIGGVLTGPITALTGTTHMLLVSGVCFAIYSVGLRQVLRAEMSDAAPETTPPAGPRDILADPYSRLLAAMRSVMILLAFVGDFVFLEQSAATFDNDESLATFLGIFIGGTTLLMVIVTAAISARFIAHYGVRVALKAMPLGIGFVAVITALWGTFVGVDSVFFILVVLTMVTNTVLSNAIETPVGAVMFQPLPADRRMPIRVAVDGWLGSFALVVAGLLLLAFAALDFDTVVPFAWLLAAIGALGTWLAGRLFLGYTFELRSATTRAFSGDGALPVDVDDASFDAIATGGPTSVFAAGALLALGEQATTDHLVDSMLVHPDPKVVEVALESVRAVGVPTSNLRNPLAAAVGRADLVASARGQALLALGAIDVRHARALASQMGSTGERDLDEAALVLELQAESDGGPVGSRLRAMATSQQLDDRLSSARMLHDIEGKVAADIAAALLIDEHNEVRLETLRSLEGNVTGALAPLVINAGRAPNLRRHAVLALAQSDQAVLDPVVDVVHELDVDYRADLIESVYSKHTRRPALLHPFVAPSAPSKVRHAGFTAIQRTGISPPASPERMLRDDVELTRHLVAAYRDLADQAPALRWAIESEFENARASIYRALSIDLDVDRVHDIQAIAMRYGDEDRANAIEALDVMLNAELRRSVIPILEPRTITEAADEYTKLPDPRESTIWCDELGADLRLDAWTTRTVAHLCDHATNHDTNGSEPMSELIERIVALKGVDIFSTLPYPLLAELAEGVAEKQFDQGDTIIENGALDQELFALTSGEVRVIGGAAADVVLAAGTVFGELAVLDPAPRSADVVAETRCTVLVVRRSTLLALTDRRPEIMVEIAGVLARRLRGSDPS